MIYPWKLKYWSSGEWQVVNERLKDLEKRSILYNPSRSELFTSLRETPSGEVKVCVVGQDPYPDRRYATGTAFAIPSGMGESEYPATLRTIFSEYSKDLGYPTPSDGTLRRWRDQGVLLWNAIPTCEAGKSLSHDWDEYSYLTKEVIETLSEKGIVFAFLGAVARRYVEFVDDRRNGVILTSHPSPRGSRSSKTPFEGSRLFSTINDKLVQLGLDPIDWRLDVQDQRDESPPGVLEEPSRVWDSNRSVSWIPGTHSGGVHHPGRLEVYE